MILGIGVDVVETNRLDEKIAVRILGEKEFEEYHRASDKKQFLASHFAVKEAFFKALGTGLRDFSFKEVELVHDDLGKPVLIFHRDVHFNFAHVSLSHDVFTIAMVVLERSEGHIYIALGSNVGDRLRNIQNACRLMEEFGIEIIKTSPIYLTKPYGFLEQTDFLNCVVEVKTDLTPFRLLEVLLEVEKQLGRTRKQRWGPRTIDLDIVLFGNLVLKTETLTIPHYDLINRQFVLRPLLDLAELRHPTEGELKKFLKEGEECQLVTRNWYKN
ncbi:2-amino-4-hydroxy-6-hydroxymethyldihydropteridine diphosphokinase [Pseudothermotoga sp.]|nr:2-amino-4-hydroxy-6-hydroxymethyldihydropteridine diphosphokinase [Pseudothermotoga sp.]MDW8140423.1 2-amino-4-hydroxy-6-hydroxymethyldihydropteridine diphosphokinase [Pseudothermotoga sp.]